MEISNCEKCASKYIDRYLETQVRETMPLPKNYYEGDPRKELIFAVGLCPLCVGWAIEYEHSTQNEWIALEECEDHIRVCFYENVFTKVVLKCVCEPSSPEI